MQERFDILLPLGRNAILVQFVHARVASLLHLQFVDVTVLVADVRWELVHRNCFDQGDQLRSHLRNEVVHGLFHHFDGFRSEET